MAHLLAAANGNWTAAGTWGLCDATFFLDTQVNNTALTTTYLGPAAGQTPGAITIDGIAVKVATRNAVPVGTMQVRVFNITGAAAVAGAEVTIDVADLPLNVGTVGNNSTGCSIGWVFFKFAAPVVLLAATSYRVEARTSTGSQVNLFRDATASNWARLLRTTTTAAPAAGDSLFVVGARTAAGAMTTRTVTYDGVGATDYGSGSTLLASIGIGAGGIFTLSIAASATYQLRLSGFFQTWVGSLTRFGIAAAPLPSSSSFRLEFDCSADGEFGFVTWGPVEGAGSPRTVGVAVGQCLLIADEAVASTVLDVDTATGWLNGDQVVIASTTRLRVESELRTLSGAAGAATVTISAGLTNAHQGTAGVQAEVVLMTRNIVFGAVTNTLTPGWYITSPVTLRWVRLEYFGGGAGTVTQVNVALPTTLTLTFCVVFEWERPLTFASTTDCALVLTDTTLWTTTNGLGFITSGNGLITTITRGAWISGAVAGAPCTSTFGGLLARATVTDLRAIGVVFNMGGGILSSSIFLLMTGCHFRAGAGAGANLHLNSTAQIYGTVRNCVFRRCNTSTPGGALELTAAGRLLVEGCSFRGANSGNVLLSPGTNASRARFVNCTFDSETGYVSSSGITLSSGQAFELVLQGCRFGSLTAPATDIINNGSFFQPLRMTLVNCTLAAAIPIASSILNGITGLGYIAYQRHQGVSGANRVDSPLGSVLLDAAVFRTATPSERISPTSDFSYLRSGLKRRTVRAGNRLTFSVYVRKDGTFTGTAKLMLRANAAVGVGETVELDAFAGAADTWVQLSGTMLAAAVEDGVVEAFVEVVGSAGNIYTDDWSAAEA